MGCDAELTHLEAADFAFSGNGDPTDCASPFIGFERKTITDLVDSMRSGRFAGYQHVKMSQLYDISYLIVEGYWRRHRDSGYLEVRNGVWKTVRGSVKYAEVDCFLCALQHQGGVHVWRTADEEETAAAICNRYLWWAKPWESHSAMKMIYAPEGTRRSGHKPTMRREATLAEKVAAQLPGVDAKAVQVAAHFKSVAAMVNATEKEWIQVEGIGKVGAKKITEAMTSV